MYSHAPADYQCPFCWIIRQIAAAPLDESPHAPVFQDGAVTILVPRHYWPPVKGNVLIIPNAHFENLYDIDWRLGNDLLRASQIVARAMKMAFGCDGVSTRQHNEPAGYQDVWHYHVHVFPRCEGDNLYASHKTRYEEPERLECAARLREALAPA